MSAEDRSDAWIRQGANVLAAGLAVFIVLPAIYPMPRAFSAVDGAIWAAWAQVVAILITGGGATFVAWTQLRGFNENARARTTVEYMNLYSSSVSQIPEHPPLTPESGLAYVEAALSDEELMSRLRILAASVYQRGGVANVIAPPELKREHTLYFAAFIVAANFFSKTAGLAREGLIDGKLFLDFYGLQVVTLWRFIQAVADVDPGAAALKQNLSLRMFAEQASAAFTSDPKPVI